MSSWALCFIKIIPSGLVITKKHSRAWLQPFDDVISIKTHYVLRMRENHTPNHDILSQVNNWWELSESEAWHGLSSPALTDSIVPANLAVDKRIKLGCGNTGFRDETVCTVVLIATAGQHRHPQARGGGKPNFAMTSHPTAWGDLQPAMYFQFRIWNWIEIGHRKLDFPVKSAHLLLKAKENYTPMFIKTSSKRAPAARFASDIKMRVGCSCRSGTR